MKTKKWPIGKQAGVALLAFSLLFGGGSAVPIGS